MSKMDKMDKKVSSNSSNLSIKYNEWMVLTFSFILS